MREIKFRGKRIDTGEWVYGGYYEWVDKTYIVQKDIYDIEPTQAWMFEVDPETIGQYTELKDMNNDEIYEDDLLEFSNKPCMYKVVWVNGSFVGAQLYTYFETVGHNLHQYYRKYHMDSITILGNIHENPELLKGS